MTMHELSGLPGNKPYCLHCELAPLIGKWLDEHPDAGIQPVIELAQNLGELVGSGLVNARREEDLHRVMKLVVVEAVKSAVSIMEAMKAKGSG